MKSIFFSLLVAAACCGLFSPVQAQETIKVQGFNPGINPSIKQPEVFSINYFNLLNSGSQGVFDNKSNFVRSLNLSNDSSTGPKFFQSQRPLNIYSTGISALGIGYGFMALHSNKFQTLNLSTKNEIWEDHPFFRTHIDDYLQFSPVVAVIGLNLAGIHGTHSFKDELTIYGISSVIMIGAVRGLKPLTHELRPDGSAYNSFPSGHTATAFAAAEWLRMEYWHKSPWIGVAGYAVATSIGVFRVYNNRHWVSDVVAGAAIGFLSTRIAYAVYPWMKTHIFHSKRKVEQVF